MLSKQQAAELLFISTKTLERRCKDGVYKFTKTGEGRFAKVSFTHNDLGLTEPRENAPFALPEVKLPYQDYESLSETYTPEITRRPSPTEAKQAADLDFAERYRMGEACDSFGNKIDGTNRLCPETGSATLVKRRDYAPAIQESQSHMAPVHRVDTSVKSADQDSVLNPGVDPATLDAMRFQFARRIGAPSMSEQMQRAYRDRRNISNSFPR